MTSITTEIRQAIEAANGKPVEIVDPETNRIYLLVNAHEFAVLPIDWSGELTQQEHDGLIREMGLSTGWDDPATDDLIENLDP